MSRLIDSLNELADENNAIPQEKLPEYRLRLILGIVRYRQQISAVIPQQNQGEYDLISGRFAKLLEASEKAGVYFLPKGELEHYYTQTQIDYLAFSDQVKSAAFHTERDHLLTSPKATIETDYAELISWLNEAVPNVEVNFRSHIRFKVIEWIQNVQLAVERGEVASLDQLRSNGRVNYSLFSQLFEATNFTLGDEKQFSCTITLADSLIANTAPITFTQATPAAEIQIANNA